MKLSNKLLIALLVILIGILFFQTVVSARKINEKRKAKTEIPVLQKENNKK
jgi:peptidoglycan hydrolase CwlO-like protein